MSTACDALFHSPCFLLGFLPALLALYWLSANRRWRHGILIVSGFAFYSLWDARFALLLMGAGVVGYVLARGMGRASDRRPWLAASLGFNLGLLFVFKYAIFSLDSGRSLLQWLGHDIAMPYYAIALPLGISFFTFKSLSYTIDVYRGEVEPTRDLLKYLAFIMLLADVVAGPIIRYKDMSGQLDALPRKLPANAIAFGITLFALGLFKKVVIADTIAVYTDPYWAQPYLLTTATAWASVVGYALQLYFDFSGYSDMAIGIGALLGLKLPQNFRAPYQALNPSDFWRRWHISLSTWLRDYVYIPLGGNRGKGLRVHANLIAVMLIGGLWHGAGWTFILWGAYHGVLLVTYKSTARWWDAAPRLAQRATTLLLVVLGWVVFRATSLAHAGDVYAMLFAPVRSADVLQAAPLLLALVLLLALALVARPTADRAFRSTRANAALAATLVTVSLFVALSRTASPFLYYQF